MKPIITMRKRVYTHLKNSNFSPLPLRPPVNKPDETALHYLDAVIPFTSLLSLITLFCHGIWSAQYIEIR